MKRSIKRSNRSKKSNRYRKRISRRRTRKNRRISRKYKRRSRKSISRKYRRSSRRKSMKGGEMSGLQKIGMGAGAVTGGLVGAVVGGDKVKLGTTLGGAVIGTGIGAGVTKLISSMGNKIHATQVNITKNKQITDKYHPEYTGSLNKARLHEIFDRECPYDRNVFYKLFLPVKEKLNGKFLLRHFTKNGGKNWNSNSESRSFLLGSITHCIYVIAPQNTLILSLITGNYNETNNPTQMRSITEVIPSYYLVTDMKACISQNNPLVETATSDTAFTIYEGFSETEKGDNKCPKSEIRSYLHQEPELDRWIIPRDVSVKIT